MQKEIPILYSTPMIQAKLAGRKTQTRRIMKIQPDNECYYQMTMYESSFGFGCIIDYNQGHENPFVKCPYGKPGDLLWARETHLRTPVGKYHYKADISDEKDANRKGYIDVGEEWAKWKPSIHMPKGGARIWDRVVAVRVERLQDISPADACDEGIEYWNIDYEALRGGELVADYMNYTWRDDPEYKDYGFPTFANPIDSYRSLWEKINGTGSWEANPWVWVVTTETLSTTGRPLAVDSATIKPIEKQ